MTDMFASVRFTTPELFLVVVPLLLLLIWQTLVAPRDRAVGFAGLEYLRSGNCVNGRGRKVIRSVIRGVLVIGLGVLWAGPSFYSAEPLFNGESLSYHKSFLVAFDMSPSMNLPADFKGYGGEDLKAGEEGLTRYEMAQAALVSFLERFRGERFGLILFSTEPFFARWPTVETGDNFIEVLESIRRGAGTQLEAFSSLTNVDKALTMARDAYEGGQGAVILISDAEDDLGNLGEAVRSLRAAGIRLYTIGVGIPDQVVKQLSDEFIGDPGFRIFRVDSEEEMQEAYRVVAEVEESTHFSGEGRMVESDVRWLFSLLLIGIAGIVLWFSEMVLHQSLSSAGETGL